MIPTRQRITMSIVMFCLLMFACFVQAKGSEWEKISGPVDSVIVGYYPVQETVRVLATKPPTGDLYEYNLSSGKWTKIGGPGNMFTVDGVGRIYALGKDKKAVFQYQGQRMKWRKIGGPAGLIVGARNGVAATNPQSGDVLLFTVGTGKWTKIGEPVRRLVSDGQGRLYALSPDNAPADKAGVYLYTGTPMKWKKIGGPAKEVYTGQRTLYVTNPQTNDLWRYDHSTSKWSRIGSPGRMFAGGTDRVVYGLAADGNAVFRCDGKSPQWQQVGGAAASIHAVGRELFAINPKSKELYRYLGLVQLVAADFTVIAADQALAQAAQDFVAWKSSRGHSMAVVTVPAIYQHFSGVDGADKIRNFLVDAKSRTKIHYVLLLGDIDKVPTRILYAGKAWVAEHRPYAADFYYANLKTKDWDPDDDGCWGEFEDDQFKTMAKHDIVVSRIPFNNANSIKMVLANIIAFEKDQGSWKRKALLACGFFDPKTDGAVLGERIDKDILKPSGWSCRKLYFHKEATESSYLGGANTGLLTSANVQKEIAPHAQGLITLSGHGNPTGIASYYTTSDGKDATQHFHSTSQIGSNFCSAVVFVSGCSTGPPRGWRRTAPRHSDHKVAVDGYRFRYPA